MELSDVACAKEECIEPVVPLQVCPPVRQVRRRLPASFNEAPAGQEGEADVQDPPAKRPRRTATGGTHAILEERRVLGRPFQLNHNMDQSGAGPAQGSAKEQKGRGRGRAARGRGRGRSSGTPADAAARPGPPTEVEDQRSTEVEHSTTEVGADHPRVKTRGPVSPAAALPGSPVRARSQNLTAQLDCLMFDSQEIGITQVAEEKPGLRVATATTGLQVATAVLEKPILMEEPETIPGFGEEEPQAHSSSPPHIAVVVPAVPALGGVEEGAPGTVSFFDMLRDLD